MEYSVNSMEQIYKKQLENEFNQVRVLGEKIGYGNMMSLASALWRKKLKDMDAPVMGAFIPVIGGFGEDEKRYDKYLNDLIK